MIEAFFYPQIDMMIMMILNVVSFNKICNKRLHISLAMAVSASRIRGGHTSSSLYDGAASWRKAKVTTVLL